MTYTNKEYAEMAIQANEQGKLLVDNGGVLELHDIPKDETVYVPQVISRFQAMSVLEETEITYNGNKVMIATAVQSYVDSLDSSTEANRAIKRAWNYASEFERTSSTITSIAALLSLTDKQVDDMFIAAAKIKG